MKMRIMVLSVLVFAAYGSFCSASNVVRTPPVLAISGDYVSCTLTNLSTTKSLEVTISLIDETGGIADTLTGETPVASTAKLNMQSTGSYYHCEFIYKGKKAAVTALSVNTNTSTRPYIVVPGN